jgi:hypothetical protein
MKRRDFVRIAAPLAVLPFAGRASSAPTADRVHAEVATPEARERYLKMMLKELVTDLGPHPVGTAECMKAEKIITREMKLALPVVETDPIPFTRTLRGPREFTVAGKPVEAWPSHGTSGTKQGGISGVLKKSASAGVAWDLVEAFSGAVLGRVTISPKEKATPRPYWFYDTDTGGLPTVCVGKKDTKILESAMAAGATVRMAHHVSFIQNSVTRNIVGTLPGESTDEIVFYAHFDTVYNSPGANDNTAAAILVLMLARSVAGMKPKKTLTFIATTGEEYGYLGTKDLAKRWKENGRLARVKYIVNFDSVTWGPSMTLITKDEGLVTLLRDIDRERDLDGEPEWRKGDGLDRETRPLRDAGLAARGIVCDSVPDNYVNEMCWHQPEDTAEHVRSGPEEVAFSLFSEYLQRVQEL